MSKWKIAVILSLACALAATGWLGARTPHRLLQAAQACRIEAHAFYIEAAATLAPGQAQAVLRLAAQATKEWPAAEAHAIALSAGEGMQRVTLAASCPADPAQAQSIERRMRMLLGRQAELSTCLTGRAQTADLSRLASDALRHMEDAPAAALRNPTLVSLIGKHTQVALRADTGNQGAMVFIACPIIPMDY